MFVLRWIRAVRSESRQKVLHETVLAIRLDSRGTTHRRQSVLPDHPKHFRRAYMVHRAGIDDYLQ